MTLELNKIYHSDNAEILAQLSENSINAVITDPPYELGFMGNKWDKRGITYQVWRWKEHLRVLKPGGYLLAFSSSRTYHRMTVAIEDAGFEIRDQIQWIYGDGMPKAKSCLKPAHNPICVARKQGELSALNIEDGRINNGTLPTNKSYSSAPVNRKTFSTFTKPDEDWKPNSKGRYPSNVILDEEVAEILDKQSGISDFSSKRAIKQHPNKRDKDKVFGSGFQSSGITTPDYNDIGGASRFFYVAKASPSERIGLSHPTIKPIALISQLVRLYTNENDLIFDGYGGSGTTAIVCKRLKRNFILCESDEKNFKEAEERYLRETVQVSLF